MNVTAAISIAVTALITALSAAVISFLPWRLLRWTRHVPRIQGAVVLGWVTMLVIVWQIAGVQANASTAVIALWATALAGTLSEWACQALGRYLDYKTRALDAEERECMLKSGAKNVSTQTRSRRTSAPH